MIHYNFGEYTRISRAAMPSVIKRNIPFMIVPCKCAINTPWNLACEMYPDKIIKEYGTFENFLNYYIYYNCNYNDLGRYPAFYVKFDDLKK